jgi:Xaa-Pro aminopeptidase
MTREAPTTAPPPAADDDDPLAPLLARAGAVLDAAAVRDLVAGVASAPPAVDGEAWMRLVAPTPDAALRDALAELLARAAVGLEEPSAAPRGRRLEALRRELRRRRLHGFVVPKGDEHQGEYVARRAERLAWLTGFSGSAGMAVVLRDKAAVFVDGRYTLQAEAEVDGDLFERRHLSDEPATDWIADNAAAKTRIGYDPWLHAPAGADRLRAACDRAGARLVASDGNPIDAVWEDQPPPPVAPVVPHDEAFAGRASADKRRQIGDAVAKGRADAALLSAPESIAWLLNLRGGDVDFAPVFSAFALVHADAGVDLFVDRRKLAAEVPRHLGPEVRVHGVEDLGPALDGLGAAGKSLRLDKAAAPDWAARRAKAAGIVVVPGDDPCQLPKACKNPVELDGMRAAHRRDGAALVRFLAWLEAEAVAGGVDEMAAAERLEALRRPGEHFMGLSFPTISGAGPNGAVVHYRVGPETNRRLEAGSLYLVDSGGQYLDGTTDVTRTVAIGTPDDEMRDRFSRVLKGHIAMATTRFPQGTTGPQLDTLARHALWQVGLDYDHGSGHGVGSYLGVHEGPQRITKVANKTALEPGMIVSNEPGYYKAGAWGIRIENLLVVVEAEAPAGAEKPLLRFDTLTLAPIDRALVEPALMSAAEIAWLDAYHARVGETLAPDLDADAGAWLAQATRPIDQETATGTR